MDTPESITYQHPDLHVPHAAAHPPGTAHRLGEYPPPGLQGEQPVHPDTGEGVTLDTSIHTVFGHMHSVAKMEYRADLRTTAVVSR